MADADLIAPVPLHRWRLFARRFNQAALLAHALGAHAAGRVAVDLLVRQRRTRSQGRLSRTARFRNVRGAFAVRDDWREPVQDARVLLLDDVQTTGAAVEECAGAETGGCGGGRRADPGAGRAAAGLAGPEKDSRIFNCKEFRHFAELKNRNNK